MSSRHIVGGYHVINLSCTSVRRLAAVAEYQSDQSVCVSTFFLNNAVKLFASQIEPNKLSIRILHLGLLDLNFSPWKHKGGIPWIDVHG